MLTVKEFKELHKLVDLIYLEADTQRLPWPKLAKQAKLSYRTVWRLGTYGTLYPRTQTIMMLARAVGMRIRIEPITQTKQRFRVVG